MGCKWIKDTLFYLIYRRIKHAHTHTGMQLKKCFQSCTQLCAKLTKSLWKIVSRLVKNKENPVNINWDFNFVQSVLKENNLIKQRCLFKNNNSIPV